MCHLSGHSSTCCTVLGIRPEHGFIGVCALTSLLQKVEDEHTKQLGKRGRKAMKYQQMAQAGDSSIWGKQTVTVLPLRIYFMPSSGSDVSVLLSVVQVQYGCVMAPHRRGPKVYAFDGGHTAHNPHRLPSAVWAVSQGHWEGHRGEPEGCGYEESRGSG